MSCNIHYSIFIYDTSTWSVFSENKIRIIKHCSWERTDKELACVPVESTWIINKSLSENLTFKVVKEREKSFGCQNK